ncbi:MAG: hypothetical protein EBT14_05785 [Betaproteobacteria bacterium]|nr:hypothetical protein [Betaproteobacteria bacterium]
MGALGRSGGRQAAPSVSGSLLSGLGEKEERAEDPMRDFADKRYRKMLSYSGFKMLPGTKFFDPDVRQELDAWRAAAGY